MIKTQTLLQKKVSDGKETISGAMSPILFVKEMAKQLDFNYDGVARLFYGNEEINQRYEGKSLTGFDHIAVKKSYTNNTLIMIFIDEGIGGCPVAMKYADDKEAVVTPIYQARDYAKKLSQKEIDDIFAYLFENKEEVFKIQ